MKEKPIFLIFFKTAWDQNQLFSWVFSFKKKTDPLRGEKISWNFLFWKILVDSLFCNELISCKNGSKEIVKIFLLRRINLKNWNQEKIFRLSKHKSSLTKIIKRLFCGKQYLTLIFSTLCKILKNFFFFVFNKRKSFNFSKKKILIGDLRAIST